jgi:hypothetical protein
MRWTIFCTLLLITAFIVIYRTTTDIWIATNGAGIIAVIFLIGVAFRVTRIFDRRWQKITTALLSVLLIGGLLSHWIIMWKMTEWQYTQLQVIRRVIYNGEVISTLRTPADDTFREFRGSPPGTRIGEVFRRLNPGGVPLVDSVVTEDTGPIFASVSDSTVEMMAEARYVTGFDPVFVNHDGRHGLAQIQIRVTPEGASYDIQN